MNAQDFISLYTADGLIRTIAEKLKTSSIKSAQLKGLSGSLDAVLTAAVYTLNEGFHLIICRDKEEAAYFVYDLQQLFGREKTIHLFPSSYKRAYQTEEIDNANILMRAEILSQISGNKVQNQLIVTYPEALTEKVINKKALTANTFKAHKGEKVDIEFLAELLNSYDFEKTDFVYEPGQFAVRGGIIDVFSYATDQPYRMELFGKEIESIRLFDADTQLSSDEVAEISIIPNVQTKLLHEVRQSFLDFLPSDAIIWHKDLELLHDVLNTSFEKAEERFEEISEKKTKKAIVLEPSALFETAKTFQKGADNFKQVQFGNKFIGKADFIHQFEAQPQPSFNKNFQLLVENLLENERKSFTNILLSDSEKQIERLLTIFEELDPTLQVQTLGIALREGFVDKQLKLVCYTDHQLFERFHRYQVKERASKSKALTLKELKTLQPGDYITHVDYGVGRFAGLEKVDVGGKMQEALRIIYRDDDLLYVNIHALHKISKYSGKEGTPPAMSKLGSADWDNKKRKVKKQVQDIAKDLISLYAKRKASPGFAFTADGFLQAELESSFLYEDTPDQAKATADVKTDMEKSYPMDRLVCGDVGFGKTEVAIRAAFKAVNDRKQAAVLVPTTILAMQHFRTFSERLANFPVVVEYINRFKSAKQIREILKRVADGQVDILVGTHRIVNKDVQFKDLGILIIDEEQKFGVKVKDRLKEMRVNVDVLTLTATPIPRTLHFSLMGARDLSVIATPPPNRQPVTTEIHTFDETIIRDAISFELRRGGQVFFVHNRISDIEAIGNLILRMVPDARIAVAHGQMDGAKLENIMIKFIEGEYDVLVSTNIIESGLDIPNANTIMINRAHMFGLSDLHQMRGRVGRSNKKAFCYLLTQPTSVLTIEARKRLQTLEEFSDLGDGFKVAMRDLDIRGAGNMLGAEQSGFITDIGFDMYHKILDEAITELKENEFAYLFEQDLKEKTKILVQDCVIETDLEILIPESYVSNISERLSLYSKLDNIKTEDEITKFITTLKDRFGPLPDVVQDLIETVRLRWVAEQLGFEKLSIKNEMMKCYVLGQENEAYFKSETFNKIIKYVSAHARHSKIKEHKKRLIISFERVNTVNQAISIAREMLNYN